MNAIADKIRKLLNTAKTGSGHEAASARRLATELMERHAITVTADECRVIVDGVHGIYWRERVLAAAAKKYGCRASKTDTITVIGEDDSCVHAAINLYNHLCNETVTTCLRVSRRGYTDIVTNLWCRIFFDTVADNLIARVNPIKPLRPVPYYEPGPAHLMRLYQSIRARTSSREINENESEIKLLSETAAQIIGSKYAIEQLIGNAKWQAENLAAMLTNEYRPYRLITANSSFLKPPPKPNRFSLLDVNFDE